MTFACPGLGVFKAAKGLTALKDVKPSAMGYMTAAYTAAQEEDHAKARDLFEEGVRSYPDEASLLNTYAWYLVEEAPENRRDPERALAVARHAVDVTKGRAGHILDTFAVALYQNGMLAEAAKRAEEAAALCPIPEVHARAAQYKKELEEQRSRSQ
jgi:tetratricopeptide (TPR) repeat protein